MNDGDLIFPFSGVDTIEDLESLPVADTNSLTTEVYTTAAKVYGCGSTFMDIFHMDQYSWDHLDNVFYPFASKQDWELASWLTHANLSIRLIDDFFSLQLVCVPFIFNENTHFD